MAHDIDGVMGDFKEGDLAFKLVSGVCGLLPFATPLHGVGGLDAVAAKRMPDHAARLAKRARELAAGPEAQTALGVADLLDKGDAGIALYSGLRGVGRAVRKSGDALETDPQQLADAGLKALGIAWIGWRLFEGDAKTRADRLFGSAAGRNLLAYFVAIDVALPFSDNLVQSGGGFIRDLVDRTAAESVGRLGGLGDGAEALGFLQSMKERLVDLSTTAAQHVQPLTRMLSERLPGVTDRVDQVASVAATAADLLSSYRLLVGQLVVEVLIERAAADVEAALRSEADQARLALEAERAAVAAAKAASAVKKDYVLDEGAAAANLDNAPIKVTRSTATKSDAGAVEKSGCGCLVLFVAAGLVAAAMGLASYA